MATRTAMTLVEELRFPGGSFRNGTVYLDPDTKVVEGGSEGDKRVVARMAGGGGGVTVDCACFIEGSGSCFPVVHDPGDGPVEVNCAALECSGESMDFCVMDIGDEGGSFGMKLMAISARAEAKR